MPKREQNFSACGLRDISGARNFSQYNRNIGGPIRSPARIVAILPPHRPGWRANRYSTLVSRGHSTSSKNPLEPSVAVDVTLVRKSVRGTLRWRWC
jgi:hypothetical protein